MCKLVSQILFCIITTPGASCRYVIIIFPFTNGSTASRWSGEDFGLSLVVFLLLHHTMRLHVLLDVLRYDRWIPAEVVETIRMVPEQRVLWIGRYTVFYISEEIIMYQREQGFFIILLSGQVLLRSLYTAVNNIEILLMSRNLLNKLAHYSCC